LSTSSVTSASSGCPPALELNMPVAHAPALGAHDRGGVPPSRLGDLRPCRGRQGQTSTSTAHRRQGAAPRQA
jgi:hypothetical protein